MQNPELVAKQQWLHDVSAALHCLTRERDLLGGIRTQLMMGLLPAEQAEANLSWPTQWRDSEGGRLPDAFLERLHNAGL